MWARLPDLCTGVVPHALDDHPPRILVHVLEGFSGVGVCWRSAFIISLIVLSLCMSCLGSHAFICEERVGEAGFSASKKRFSLRLSLMSVSLVFVSSLRSLCALCLRMYILCAFCVHAFRDLRQVQLYRWILSGRCRFLVFGFGL